MKTKLFAAALAALTLGAMAQTASAQDFWGDRNDFRGDWRRGGEITVRQDGRTMSFNRGDRMFYRLMDRPYNFVPGLSYAFTDRCNRFGCQVIVYSPRAHRIVDSTFAPRLFDRRNDRGFDDRRFDRRDGGFDDRRFDDRRFDDYGRDHGNYDRNHGNNDRLYGAPR